MRLAISSPHPYLLNQAGGICAVKTFSLVGDLLKIEPASEQPMTGDYELIYRCVDHSSHDIRRAVSSDGASWQMLDKLPPGEDCDVCYPEPCA